MASMASNALTFHPRCGKKVRVSDDGLRIERADPQRDKKGPYNAALTSRPLNSLEKFQIQISGSPWLAFGITTHSPEDFTIPKYMRYLEGTWVLDAGTTGGHIVINTATSKRNFLSRARMRSFRRGDILALQVTKERNLLYFLNGKSIGIAATAIPENVYGFIETQSAYSFVNLVPDAQSVMESQKEEVPTPIKKRDLENSMSLKKDSVPTLTLSTPADKVDKENRMKLKKWVPTPTPRKQDVSTLAKKDSGDLKKSGVPTPMLFTPSKKADVENSMEMKKEDGVPTLTPPSEDISTPIKSTPVKENSGDLKKNEVPTPMLSTPANKVDMENSIELRSQGVHTLTPPTMDVSTPINSTPLKENSGVLKKDDATLTSANKGHMENSMEMKKEDCVPTLTPPNEDVSTPIKSTPVKENSGDLKKNEVPTPKLSTPENKVDMENSMEVKASKVKVIKFSELEFQHILGRGGQGAVYMGLWKKRAVAIKQVLGKIRKEEAEILSQLSHPNVIAFYGLCTDRIPDYFIITELAEGGSLYDLLYVNHSKPNQTKRLQWTKEIAEGMTYLHQQKVIHRDLKTHNVLVSEKGGIKLCDFGSAKEFDHTTLLNAVGGTYRWMAPEVLKGKKVSLSSDVYSYGMVVFEIFKLEVPFSGVIEMDVMIKCVQGERPAIPDSLESYLANLIKSCWQSDPKARPSFQEILDILKNKECAAPVDTSFKDDLTDIDLPSRLQRKLSMTDVPRLKNTIADASPVWFQLGLGLDLSPESLKDIAKCAGSNNTQALTQTLQLWITDPLPATLQSLVACLSSHMVNKPSLSQHLIANEDKFGVNLSAP